MSAPALDGAARPGARDDTVGPHGAAPVAPVPQAVARRAIEWLLALQDPQAHPDATAQWRAWRAEHPDHERAWQRIESVNRRMDPLAGSAAAARMALAAPASRRRAMGGLAAVLLVAGGTAWVVQRQPAWRTRLADYRTGRGERRRLVLADGTVLRLDADSAVDVRYDALQRRVRLHAGAVLVDTAPDAAGRPFFVDTAQGTAQALGTRFTVRDEAGAIDIAVFEGRVRVQPSSAADAFVLAAGEQRRFADRMLGPVGAADPDGSAWVDGRLVARRMRLAEVLAVLSRYSALPLSCDPAVAGLRVSGSYPLDDVDRVLDTLCAVLQLEAQTTTRFWGLRPTRIHLAARRMAAPPGTSHGT